MTQGLYGVINMTTGSTKDVLNQVLWTHLCYGSREAGRKVVLFRRLVTSASGSETLRKQGRVYHGGSCSFDRLEKPIVRRHLCAVIQGLLSQ